MFRRVSMFLAVVACAATAFAGGKVRTWTSADGRTMQAEFVRELDGDVTFLKDGKLIVIRAEKLSKQDQKDIQDLAAGKEPEQDPFDAPSAGGSTPGNERPVAEEPPDSERPKKLIAVQTRTWTDRLGARSSGKFVRVDGNDVVLSRGARFITVPFANLSEVDQEYVRDLLTSQGKEADIPSDNPSAAGGGSGGNVPGGDNGFQPARRGGVSGPGGFPGAPGGIGAGGGMPPGAFPPRGIGRGGMAGGPGMGAGIGMPPGMRPPVDGDVALPGSARELGPTKGGKFGGPPGSDLPGNGPFGNGFPGSSFPNTGPIGGGLGSSERMPATGMLPAGAMPGMIPESTGMDRPRLGSLPRSGIPSLEPGSIPSIPSTTMPSMEMEEYFQCSKCNGRLSKLEAAGSSCPQCHTIWGFKQDQFGNKTMTAASSGRLATVGVVVVILVVLGMVVFIALFIGIIVAIVKATSIPTQPPQPCPPQMPQQRYY